MLRLALALLGSGWNFPLRRSEFYLSKASSCTTVHFTIWNPCQVLHFVILLDSRGKAFRKLAAVHIAEHGQLRRLERLWHMQGPPCKGIGFANGTQRTVTDFF